MLVVEVRAAFDMRAAQPALTVLDVRRLPVMLSMGRARNHPGDTADRWRIAGGECPLDRLVDIAFALATVRMLLSIPAAHIHLHGTECRTRPARIRRAACRRHASVECRRSQRQHRPDPNIPPGTRVLRRNAPDMPVRTRSGAAPVPLVTRTDKPSGIGHTEPARRAYSAYDLSRFL